MTKEEAGVIIGNIPVMGDECYTIAEYQQAKSMAIEALSAEPCEDTISRQEALKCFTWTNDKADAWNRIKNLPSVTSKQKTGHWKDRYHDMFKYYCSECETGSDLRTSYCPNCGAKMEESED